MPKRTKAQRVADCDGIAKRWPKCQRKPDQISKLSKRHDIWHTLATKPGLDIVGVTSLKRDK